MDTAFYNRTGFTSGWSFGEVNFYPEGRQDFWMQRVHPFLFRKARTRRGAGRRRRLPEHRHSLQLHAPGLPERLATSRGHEAVARPASSRPAATSTSSRGMQILRWLNVNGSFGTGPAIYLRHGDSVPGRLSSAASSASRFSRTSTSARTSTSTCVRFDRASTGERVYDVDIVNLTDHLSVRQALPGAAARAVRQLDASAS